MPTYGLAALILVAQTGCASEEGVTEDTLGRRWAFVGAAADLPWGDSTARDAARGGSAHAHQDEAWQGADPGDSITKSFVLVTDNPDGVWTAWELVENDPELVRHLEQEYSQQHPTEAADSDPEPLPGYRWILWGDDRTEFEDIDPFVPGGSSDSFTAVRRVMTPIEGPEEAQGTGTMLESRKGITVGHNYFDGGELIAFGEPYITYPDATGVNFVTRIFLNADYVDNELLAHDWALFYTASAVSMGNGDFFTLDTTPNDESYGDTVNNLGIHDVTAFLHAGCQIKDVLQERLSYNCDTEGGHSGGPTYRYFSATQTRQIVANHAGFGGAWNTGPRITSWLGEIQSGLVALPTGAGTQDPFP